MCLDVERVNWRRNLATLQVEDLAVRRFRLRLRLRLRTMMILIGLSTLVLTVELGRQRRVGFRGMARRLAAMEDQARHQAEGATSSAEYHRSTAARGGLDPATAAEFKARAERLVRMADDWRRQADSMRRSRVAHERAAVSWLPVDPDPPPPEP
jgi:hypothetical protein